MYPPSATTRATADGGEAAAAQQCRGCSAPLPRAALMFGAAETRDLCARCTLEYYYRTGGLGAGSRSSTGRRHATCPFAFAAAATTPPPPVENQRPNTNRCAACPKKVGLLGFACRCGGTFRSTHRHADSHGCSFDYRYRGRGFATRDREAGASR